MVLWYIMPWVSISEHWPWDVVSGVRLMSTYTCNAHALLMSIRTCNLSRLFHLDYEGRLDSGCFYGSPVLGLYGTRCPVIFTYVHIAIAKSVVRLAGTLALSRSSIYVESVTTLLRVVATRSSRTRSRVRVRRSKHFEASSTE